jgi:phosphoglycerol transferase
MARKACPFGVACVAALLICVLIMAKVLGLRHADLRVPFLYWSDTLCVHMMVKGMIDNGWYWENDYLGAPGRFQMYDYPMADNLHFGVMKLISLAVPDFAVVCNGYYLLTFPLITLCSLAVFRHFKISYGPCILGSLLFSFLPYHFQRSQSHLFLSAYYLVPPMVMVILWVYSSKLFCCYAEEQDKCQWDIVSWRSLMSVVICLLVSSAGVYYAFFACYLLGVAGLAASILRRSVLPFIPAAFLVFVITLGTLANLYPSLAFWHNNGPNRSVASRTMGESEVWALKTSQLFVPLRGHRFGTFATLESKYSQQSSLCDTNDYMGVIGCVGFVLLLARLAQRKSKSACVIRLHPEPDAPARPLVGASGSMQQNAARPVSGADSSLMDSLAFLTIAAMLLATIGGFGSLFNLLVTNSIRCYYRMVVYVAFFCLFAAILTLDRLCRKYFTTFRVLSLGYGVLAGLLLVGIYDQTSRAFALDYTNTKRDYLQDRAFVSAIEASLPADAMIFQLPYKSFPESGVGPHNLQDYELFRAYLHSKHLHWSYGAMRDRESDLWQASLVRKPLLEQVESLARAGFSGIYIDRNGFPDAATALERELASLLAARPLISENHRLAFHSLMAYRPRCR